jgi:hypothetical protein
VPCSTQRAFGQQLEPECRVFWIARPQNRHADLGESEEGASNGLGSQRTGVKVGALDEEIGMSGDRLHAGYLAPEPAIDDRQMQVAHTLPLDENPADLVIPKPQSPTNESHLELPQSIEHPTLPLVDVNDKEQPHDEILCSNRDPL